MSFSGERKTNMATGVIDRLTLAPHGKKPGPRMLGPVGFTHPSLVGVDDYDSEQSGNNCAHTPLTRHLAPTLILVPVNVYPLSTILVIVDLHRPLIWDLPPGPAH